MPKFEGAPAPEEQESVAAPLSENFSDVLRGIADAQIARGGELKPYIQQDGGEIHRSLQGEGVTFNFYVKEAANNEQGRVAVNFSGDYSKHPWLAQLTGKVFEDFTQAKSWLRAEAEKLAGE